MVLLVKRVDSRLYWWLFDGWVDMLDIYLLNTAHKFQVCLGIIHLLVHVQKNINKFSPSALIQCLFIHKFAILGADFLKIG